MTNYIWHLQQFIPTSTAVKAWIIAVAIRFSVLNKYANEYVPIANQLKKRREIERIKIEKKNVIFQRESYQVQQGLPSLLSWVSLNPALGVSSPSPETTPDLSTVSPWNINEATWNKNELLEQNHTLVFLYGQCYPHRLIFFLRTVLSAQTCIFVRTVLSAQTYIFFWYGHCCFNIRIPSESAVKAPMPSKEFQWKVLCNTIWATSAFTEILSPQNHKLLRNFNKRSAMCKHPYKS